MKLRKQNWAKQSKAKRSEAKQNKGSLRRSANLYMNFQSLCSVFDKMYSDKEELFAFDVICNELLFPFLTFNSGLFLLIQVNPNFATSSFVRMSFL